MRLFAGSDDEEEVDSCMPMPFAKDDKEAKRRYAQEIVDGEVMGTWCRDEEVWEMVREMREKNE